MNGERGNWWIEGSEDVRIRGFIRVLGLVMDLRDMMVYEDIGFFADFEDLDGSECFKFLGFKKFRVGVRSLGFRSYEYGEFMWYYKDSRIYRFKSSGI